MNNIHNMAYKLSAQGWVVGLLSFGLLGFVIVGGAAKASGQSEPRSVKSKGFHQNSLSFPS